MAELKIEAGKCIEEEVVLDEKFRRRMSQSIKRNRVLLEKLSEL